MRKPTLWIALIVCFLVVLIWRGVHPSGEIATDLLFGWVSFLRRTHSQVSVRWDGIAVFAVALSAATLIAHLLLRSAYRQKTTGTDATQRSWRLRWTVSLMSFVVLAFVAGISFVGVTHQVSWLLTSPTPLFGYRVDSRRGTSESRLSIIRSAIAVRTSGVGFPTRAVIASEGFEQSWVVPILPYLGYTAPEVDVTRGWDDSVNAPHFRALVPELINPSFRSPPLRDANGFGLNHYAGNAELFESEREPAHDASLFDQSNLLLLGEVNAGFVPWGQPGNSRYASNGLHTVNGFGGSADASGTLFVMADGSVRLIDNDVDPAVLEALGRPATVRAEHRDVGSPSQNAQNPDR